MNRGYETTWMNFINRQTLPGSGVLSWENIRPLVTTAALVLVDYVAILLAVAAAYSIRLELIPLKNFGLEVPVVYVYAIIPFSFLLFLHYDRLYIRRLYFWQQTEKLFKASIFAMLLVVMILYFSGSAKEISRVFILLSWLLSFCFLAVGRYLLKRISMAFDIFRVPVVIVGAGKTAQLLIEAFENNIGSGYKIVGLIEDKPECSTIKKKYPIIGTFARAEEAIHKSGVKNVLIAAPGLSREALLEMVYRLQPCVDNVTFVPDLFGVPVGSMELETLLDEKTVLLKIRNNLAQTHNRVFKFIFDCICSLFGLLVIAPLFLVICVLVYMDSPGPIVFGHKRVGRNGQMFMCYKFRTMVVDAEKVLERYLNNNVAARAEWDRDFKLKDDPRVTRIGKFLRKTSLDELPQFINVLKGEMSLVGPRPIVREEVARYEEYINDYYLVRPGITGMWQVSGRNDIPYPERTKMDSWYVRNWSLWLDIVIIMKTVKVVLDRKGAY